MKLEIVQAGNPILRRRARPLSLSEISSSKIQNLIESMKTCMRDAPGVGLAAPQIGLSLQLAVIEDREEYQKEVPEAQLHERERRPVPFHVLINPKILATIAPPAEKAIAMALTPAPASVLKPAVPPRAAGGDSESVEFFEGCLSLSGFMAVVPRAWGVRVECLDEHGNRKVIEADGWYARILQHEIDHLHGHLYIDRMQPRTFTSMDNWTEFWKGKPVTEVVKTLDFRSGESS